MADFCTSTDLNFWLQQHFFKVQIALSFVQRLLEELPRFCPLTCHVSDAFIQFLICSMILSHMASNFLFLPAMIDDQIFARYNKHYSRFWRKIRSYCGLVYLSSLERCMWKWESRCNFWISLPHQLHSLFPRIEVIKPYSHTLINIFKSFQDRSCETCYLEHTYRKTKLGCILSVLFC